MIPATSEPAARDSLRVAFLASGALFFGLAVLDRALTVAAVFSSLLLTIFAALLLAFLITPLVEGLEHRLHLRRALAIGAAYGSVVGAVALFVVAVAQIGVREATDLAGRVDQATASVAGLASGLQRAIGLDRSTVDLAALVEDAQRHALPAVLQGLASQTQAIAADVLAVLGTLFIVVVISVYAVADPSAMTGTVRRIVPNRHADTLLLVERTVGRSFRGFLRAQLVLVLVQVGITLVLCLAFGIPYPFLLTVGSGILMFVPFFGPPLALVPVAFVAFAFRPDVALPVTVVLVASQTVLVNLIQPRLLRREVGLHPILVLVALLFGAQVAGLWGAIFSIPLCAVATLLARYVIDARAVNEVEGIELSEAVAAIQAEHPGIEVEEAVGMAADQAEAMLEADTARREPGGPSLTGPRGRPGPSRARHDHPSSAEAAETTVWPDHVPQAKKMDTSTETLATKRSFSTNEALAVATELAIDFDALGCDLEQFRMGLDVELEHGPRGPGTDVSGGDRLVTGKIALAHLTEFPDYYTRLAVLETEAAAHQTSAG